MDTPSFKAVVIGGGITGAGAAYELAENNIEVHIIEKDSAAGGREVQWDRLFPGFECAKCIGVPDFTRTWQHPGITLHTLSEVSSVEGKPGNFTVTLNRKPRYVDESRCIDCAQCAEVCPREMPNPFTMGGNSVKLAHRRFPAACPQAFVISLDDSVCAECGKCQDICPTRAIDLSMESKTEILGGVAGLIIATGFVFGNSIKEFKKSTGLTDADGKNIIPDFKFELQSARKSMSGKPFSRPSDGEEPRNVAFIVTDQFLNENSFSPVSFMQAVKNALRFIEHGGESASVYYRHQRVMGKGFQQLLTQAMENPQISFCRKQPRISAGKSGGFTITDSSSVSDNIHAFDMIVVSTEGRPSPAAASLAKIPDFPVNSSAGPALTDQYGRSTLIAEGIYIAGGAHHHQDITSCRMEAYAAAADLLSDLRLLRDDSVLAPENDTVKNGAPLFFTKTEQVEGTVVFLCHCGGTLDEKINFTELEHLVRQSGYEVRHIHTACQPAGKEELISSLEEEETNRIVLGACSTRFREKEFNSTFFNAGFDPSQFFLINIREQAAWIHRNNPVRATHKAADLLHAGAAKAAGAIPGIYTHYPASRRVVILGGGAAAPVAANTLSRLGFTDIIVLYEQEDIHEIPACIPEHLITSSGRDFLNKEVAGVRSNPDITVICGGKWISSRGNAGAFETVYKDEKGFRKKIDHGALIIANGADPFIPESILGYGSNPMVMTQHEIETAITSDILKLTGSEQIVMIQCVGSRDSHYPHCSRTCCYTAIENARAIKKKNPRTPVTIVHRDIQLDPEDREEFSAAVREGVEFIYDEAASSSSLEEIQEKYSPDYLVLSTGTIPKPQSKRIGTELNIPVDDYGWFKESQTKLSPVETRRKGIFICGFTQSPQSFTSLIEQARAAALKTSSLLSKGVLHAEGRVSVVEPAKCVSCLTCVRTCPYGIPIINQKKAEISPVDCHGCGVCVSNCPNDAIQLVHGTGSQIKANISNLLKTDMR